MEDLLYSDEVEALLKGITLDESSTIFATSSISANVDFSDIPPESRFIELPMGLDDNYQPDQSMPRVDGAAMPNHTELETTIDMLAKRLPAPKFHRN
jgi:hypothetical protein